MLNMMSIADIILLKVMNIVDIIISESNDGSGNKMIENIVSCFVHISTKIISVYTPKSKKSSHWVSTTQSNSSFQQTQFSNISLQYVTISLFN